MANNKETRGSQIPGVWPSARDRPAHGSPHLLLIVCPTEYGGHIEHAAELAAAATRSGVCDASILLSRGGASQSVSGWDGSFEVREILHPRRTGPKAIRIMLQLADIRSDQRAIHRSVVELAQTNRVTVLYETSKYGIMRTPVGVTNLLFVHNAVPHSIQNMTLRDRLFQRLERSAAGRADRVIVHGAAQRAIVQKWARSEVTTVDLPGDTRPVGAPTSKGERRFALCLGEVRPNKGIETAMAAAAMSNVKLVVAGQPEPLAYGSELNAKTTNQDLEVRLGYLQPEAFVELLYDAAVVLLPYQSFAAQSGVLARAMQCGKRIVASSLPALKEQAQGYPRIDFFPVGDSEALALCLAAAMEEPESDAPHSERAAEIRKWDSLAKRVLS